MNISTTDAQGLYTKMLVDAYKERSKPTAFLRSFFPDKVVPTLELSIEVQRGFEKVAVDVVRGTDGNRNQFTKSTEKIFIPPYYREWFDATQLQLYDRLYGATQINDAVFAAYINSVVDSAMDLQAKIERAYEVQCAEVLETGIVQLNAGINIDFKRKAASLVDTGVYFNTGGSDPYAMLEAGANFIRMVGKTADVVFNALLGSEALTALLVNTKFLARQNLFNMALDAVAPPQLNAVGATYHGTLTCGSFKVQLWAYPQFYDHKTTGVATPYLNPKKVIMLPSKPKFVLGFGAVPQLMTPNNPVPKMGAFIINEYIDERGKARIVDIESAGVAIPTAVDTIYTFKAVSG
jgi:hypothetical protein